ncbi:MAG: N-methyl-L-tryptophan oxidase [Candidatus Eremiobacteraeota bacterium]|nr:N-methyl-L-tryptophan oxidase [Candidatus Eremiobacteraeota bacterium]
MGSATAAHSARRGSSVVGLEQFTAAHTLGASHGGTRLIRLAYFEGADYVPLLRRAYELWNDLEAQTVTTLRSRTGGIFVGTPQTNLISGTLASARAHDLAVEILDPEQLRLRHPQFLALPDEVGVFEPSAGAVFPEAAVRAHLRVAAEHGADLRFETRVKNWAADAGHISITLDDGTNVRARKLAICAGPWLNDVLDKRMPVRIERNVQVWFEPLDPDKFAERNFCAFALERDGKFFYGFPDYGDGVKCAFHHTGDFTTPQQLQRDVSQAEIERNRAQLAAFIPGAAGRYRSASACMYALTPDEHFVIGPHPNHQNVYVAGGFSGHGFKFCPVVGEIMADYLLDGGSRHAVAMFSPTRFSN